MKEQSDAHPRSRAAASVPSAVDTRARPDNRTLGYLFVVGAAAMWGTIGFFFTLLHETLQLSALTIGLVRAAGAVLILLPILAFFRPSLLRVPPRVLGLYAAFGLIGVALFYVLYPQAVLMTNLATAAVLLYTAPAFVTLFARWRWDEPITGQKMIALVVSFAGCALVARAYDPNQLQLSWAGVLVGALAGLTYACFTIFAKYASGQSPWTTVTYSLLFGTLFLLPVQLLAGAGAASLAPGSSAFAAGVLLAVGLCVGPTLGSYALYTAALRRVPASNASVVATIEPLVASGVGFWFFQQALEPLQIVGAAMIVGSALALSLRS